MTLEFAKSEASRRSSLLKKTHYVYHEAEDPIAEDAYFVVDRKLQTPEGKDLPVVFVCFHYGGESCIIQQKGEACTGPLCRVRQLLRFAD